MNSRLSSRFIGQFLITIGTISILAFIFLIIFFVGYFRNIPSILFFGPLNDIFGSLEAILSALLATITLFFQPKRWIWLNLIGAVITWIGAFIVTLDSLMAGGFIPTTSAAMLRIKFNLPAILTTNDLHFGFGLIGIWLLILNFQAILSKPWPTYLVGLGFLTGILMMIGLFGFLPALGFVFLYPTWCILSGRSILKMQERITNDG